MSLCLAAGTLAATLAVESFTLAWTHSIERVRWEEDWRVEGRSLVITEARIRGTGAGMEPPEDAVLVDGVWHYRPHVRPLPRLLLANSSYVAAHELCLGDRCRRITEILPGLAPDIAIELSPCRGAAG